jgi:hypothetical protein
MIDKAIQALIAERVKEAENRLFIRLCEFAEQQDHSVGRKLWNNKYNILGRH